jgi:chemotaxis protein CheZ
MEHKESSQADFESTLKKHAHQLVESLEKGQFGDAVQLIHELNQTRDRGLYQEVGKLTRELHSAIVNFQIDPHMPQAEEISQITDATERLSYVVRLTEAAANRTMDLVENATPLVNGMANEAKALSTDWGRFMRREVGLKSFVSWRVGSKVSCHAASRKTARFPATSMTFCWPRITRTLPVR